MSSSTIYDKHSGFRNHSWFIATPNAPFWFYQRTNLAALYNPAAPTVELDLTTHEVATYAPFGVRIRHGSALNGNLMDLTVEYVGLDPFSLPIRETMRIRGDSRIFGKGNVQWFKKTPSRVDRIRITFNVAPQANDELEIGYPASMAYPIPNVAALDTYSGLNGLSGNEIFGYQHVESFTVAEPIAYAELILDTAATNTLRVAANDRLVLTDDQVVRRWDFVAGAAGANQISLAGITTAKQLRDHLISVINAAQVGGMRAYLTRETGAENNGGFRIRGGTERMFIELFRWNAGNPTIIKNGAAAGVAWMPRREYVIDPAGIDAVVNLGATHLDGDGLILGEGTAEDRFQFRTGATAVASGFTAVTIGNGGTVALRNFETATALRTAINTLGAPNTTWKGVLFDVTDAIGSVVLLVNAPGSATAIENAGGNRIHLSMGGAGYQVRCEGLRTHACVIDFTGFCHRAATGSFDPTGVLAKPNLLAYIAWDLYRFERHPQPGLRFVDINQRPALGGPKSGVANNGAVLYRNLLLQGQAAVFFMQSLEYPGEVKRGQFGLFEVKANGPYVTAPPDSKDQRPGRHRQNQGPAATPLIPQPRTERRDR